ncbi:MAG TPA: hypothetical protein VJZ70_01490 [Limnochordia bacterium]|nr:hypothetical protein [Limnochordia bacterium]
MRNLKRMTKASSLREAIQLVWQAGLASYLQETPLDERATNDARLEQELLSLSQLVHDYETKIHNNVRENQELTQKNKELEWGYRALLRENQWLREEIFKLKGKPLL